MKNFRERPTGQSWLLALALSVLAVGCGGDGGRDPILGSGGIAVLTAPPTVTAVAPADGAIDVPINNTIITAEFSERMAPLGGDASFTVSCAAPCASPTGTVALDATQRIATFTLTPGTTLAPNTLYTAAVTGARSLETGLALASPYVWRFTTGATPDTTRPRVTITQPATTSPGPTGGVPANTAITAVFTEAMAPATINAGSFTVTCAAPCVSPAGTVSYTVGSATAVFTPAAPLAAGQTYTATITSAATDLAGNALAGNQAPLPGPSNYVWTFTTTNPVPPANVSVASTSPAAGAAGVCPTATISATFNVPSGLRMDPTTVNTATFTVAGPGANPVAASSVVLDSATGRTATFTPQNALTNGVTYTARVRGGANGVKDLAVPANGLGSDFTWSFTAATRYRCLRAATPAAAAPAAARAPTVTAVAPVNNATGVAINDTIITAEFSEPMRPFTGGATFTVTCTGTCTNPTGTVTLDTTQRIATFTLTPGTTLEPETRYTATVTGARSLATNLALASPYVWRFNTAATADTTRPRVTVTQPATTNPGPTPNVPANTAITATFTEAMAPATILAAGTFTVTCAGPCVSPAGNVTYSVGSRTAVFTPDAPLAISQTYTATITTAATDLAGNALAGNQAPLPAASNYVWTFTTSAVVPPAPVTVSSTNPAANATGVCPNATINATFNVPSGTRMDPATVTSGTFTVTGPGPGFAPVTAESVVLDVPTGRTATFTPLDDLTTGVTYTARIRGGPTGVKDLAVPANQMSSDVIWSFTVGPASGSCLQPVPLGAIEPFGIFGGSAGMTNQGIQTVINGDIGTIAVSTAVTGFHDSLVTYTSPLLAPPAGTGCTYTETTLNIGAVNGLIYTAPPPPTIACPNEGTAATLAIATAARADGISAYNQLVALPPGPDPGAGSLANQVLAPGVYTSAGGTFSIIGGPLTLDAMGNPNAVWVFQMSTSLTVGAPGASQSVLLVNGAEARNVFWQVGSAATINGAGGGTMVGTIITQAGLTFSTAGNNAVVTLNGRALSLNASVTVVNTVINVPAP